MVELEPPIEWLLTGEPYIVYRTRRDLLLQEEDHPQVSAARQAMLADPLVQGLIAELSGWPGSSLTSHKNAGHLIHKLTFLAELGLQISDPGVGLIVERILAHQSSEGPWQVLLKIPQHFGGTGEDQWAWALCDAPLLVYALLKLGLEDVPAVQSAAEYLSSLIRPNGFPCVVSRELESFHGPGRKDDPCPYATLLMLQLLAARPKWQESPAARTAAECLLQLWIDSCQRHPYLFYMGTDFRKLKVPFVWYDLLHVLEVLSRFSWLKDDERLREMAAVMQGKRDSQGCFTPESVWAAWKDWEFGQKKIPSRWLTLQAWRIWRQLH